MKLLFDQNISERLVDSLRDVWPQSSHVRTLGLHAADDEIVWNLARAEGFTIVSKDSDFHQRAFAFGPPPKVIWIQRGNCSTSAIEELLRRHQGDILAFEEDHEAAFLVLS